jgi:hypothetical protein
VYQEEYDANTCPDLLEPTGYDGARMRKEVKGSYVVVRLDRFVFAACNTAKSRRMRRGRWWRCFLVYRYPMVIWKIRRELSLASYISVGLVVITLLLDA